MYSYVAFGLNIHSTFPLPELMTTSGSLPDVIIRRAKISRPLPKTDNEGMYFELNKEEAYLFWEGVGAFLVRNGRDILVDPLSKVEDHIVRLPLLGTVLSAAIQQRGFLTLHASAVAIDGGAIAFLGHRGAGKSTMAATLYGRGHTLLADDSVVMDMSNAECPMVVPGFPQLKLFPEAAVASLGDDPETLPRLIPGFEKRSRHTIERFSPYPLPLTRVYVLERGEPIEIAPMRPQDTIVQIISHSYVARIFKNSLKGTLAASHLLQCANLANKVPFYKLKRNFSLSCLPEVAHLVEQEMCR